MYRYIQSYIPSRYFCLGIIHTNNDQIDNAYVHAEIGLVNANALHICLLSCQIFQTNGSGAEPIWWITIETQRTLSYIVVIRRLLQQTHTVPTPRVECSCSWC